MQEYVDKRKALEQGDKDKTEPNPNPPKVDRANHNSPPITRTQYPPNNTTRANTAQAKEEDDESTDDEEERKVYASLQRFCNDRFVKVTRKVHAGTTTLANTVHYNRLIFDSLI